MTFEPVHARPRIGHSKIRLARDGVKFFLILLRVITIFSPFRIFLPISLAALVLGLAYGGWTAFTQHKIPNGSVLLLMGLGFEFGHTQMNAQKKKSPAVPG